MTRVVLLAGEALMCRCEEGVRAGWRDRGVRRVCLVCVVWRLEGGIVTTIV